MAAMFQQFIYRGTKYAKRKTQKQDLNAKTLPVPVPPSPGSFHSPLIINDDSVRLSRRSSTPSLRDEESQYARSFDSEIEDRRAHAVSPQLEVDIPLTDWFTHETLRMAGALAPSTFHVSNGSGSNSGSLRGTVSAGSTKGREGPSAEEAIETASSAGAPSSEDLRRFNFGKPIRKPTTTPLRIPNVPMQAPQPKSRRSGHTKAISTSPHPSQGRSPQYPNDLSSISGTKLARALIGNSYVLSHDAPSRPQSNRSGARVDSATLPHGEHPFLNSSFWRDKRISGGDIVLTPNASGISPTLPPPKGHRPSASDLSGAAKRHKSIHEVSSSGGPDSRPLPPLLRSATAPGAPGQILSTSEAVSQLHNDPALIISAPDDHPTRAEADRSQAVSGSSQAPSFDKIRLAYDDSDVPLSDDEGLDRGSLLHPRKSHSRRSYSDTSLAPKSPQAMSITNVIESYMLTASGESNWSIGSPTVPESKAGAALSPTIPPTTPQRPNRARESAQILLHTNSAGKVTARADWVQRAKPAQDVAKVRLLPIGERGSLLVPQSPYSPGSVWRHSSIGNRVSSIPTSIPTTLKSPRFFDGVDGPLHSPDPLDGKLAPISRPLFARERSGSTPSPITVIRDSRNASHYDITGDGEEISLPEQSPFPPSEHQTFPETPNAFSPGWTTGSSEDSHAPPTMPSISVAQGLARPTSLYRTSSVVGPRKEPLSQRVLLSRAVSISGEKPVTGGAKLNPVPEAKESATSSPSSPFFQPLPVSTAPSTSLPTPPTTGEDMREPTGSEAVSVGTPAAREASSPPYSLSDFSSGSHSDNVPQAINATVVALAASTAAMPSTRTRNHTESPPPEPPSSAITAAPGHIAPAIIVKPPPPAVEVKIDTGDTPKAATPAPVLPTHLPSTLKVARPPGPRRPSELEINAEPPPYDGIVSGQRSAPHPQQVIKKRSGEALLVRKRGEARLTSSSQPSTPNRLVDSRDVRNRPPLPIGPRKPALTQPLTPGTTSSLPDRNRSGSMSTTRNRNGSASSSGGTPKNGGNVAGSSNWRKTLAKAPSPKFSTPVPKHRGYTMEAATWTFTSQQLQAVVSRAIKQTAETSSVRLLPLEALDNDIPADLHHLEMQKMDVKMRYKAATRTRWALLSALAVQIETVVDPDSALAMVEELTEVSATLDKLADELHCVTQQIAQLTSLTEVHSASALAVALRKLNTSFLRQMAENAKLRQDIIALEDERDEAWKEAEEVAHEYDDLFDRYGGDDQTLETAKTPINSSRRSSHVLAVRKSSILASKSGLRHSLRRSHRSSTGSNGRRASGSMHSVSAVPPVPRKPYGNNLSASIVDFPSRSSMGAFTRPL
ncbi:hypothetical protein HWV62_25701 [Athelia sp. TMB]|nr:hypothetical protein HWV62_25701 [Athelia sp. TMB]